MGRKKSNTYLYFVLAKGVGAQIDRSRVFFIMFSLFSCFHVFMFSCFLLFLNCFD